MKIISTLKCTEYEFPGHPESPERIRDAYDLLKRSGFEFIEPKECSDEDILIAHSEVLLNNVKSGTFFDMDTPNLPGIFKHARLSVGAAIQAAKRAKAEKTFSLMRPPGHHATRNSLGGFCYFNNIAVAVKKSLLEYKNAAVLDFDVHHGNGTEDIFLKDNRLLYISLHQSPLYPRTGLKSYDNCINFPLPGGMRGEEYVKKIEQALDKIRDFGPGLLGVSCGFDTFKDDPIGGLQLDLDTFYDIGNLIKGLNIPTFCILEGGYSDKLAECILRFLEGIS
jgi:acetoin utilization deacetylase AcuC-like enzyme